MTTMIIFVGIALALLLALLWLMRERPQARELTGAELKSRIEELFPLHLKYFAQVRQALSPADQEYLKERASRRIQRQARAERLDVARRFLDGLRDDFFRLERLGRAVAALRKLSGSGWVCGSGFFTVLCGCGWPPAASLCPN